ncbi:MAG: lysine--tRNA ligase, partial [Clostridia bacterium]|nr:lysine--tRNA ligase [Clostridia bacterium]
MADVQIRDYSEQEQIRRDKLQTLMQQGNNPYLLTKYPVTHRSQEILAHYDALEGQTIAIAGRMTSRRVMGKAAFAHILDGEGGIQIYVKRDDVGEDVYAAFKSDDIGDLLGVTGKVFKTKTGETSIHAETVTLLAKSLHPLPEKFHGLQDTDVRYRQRYLDLIVNPEVKDTFVKRSKIISAIRRYLDDQGFIEVETPMLVSNAGGAAARPFETHFNALDEDVKLRISLE